MAKIKLDIIEGSELLTLKTGGTRETRVAFVYELDNANPAAVKHLALQVGGLPRQNDPHPSNNLLRVVGYDVRPTGDPTQAFVLIFYESIVSAGFVPQEMLAVRTTVTIAQVSTQRLRAGGKILKVYAGGSTDGPSKIATVSYPMPMKNRVLYGLFSSPPPESWADCVATVNDSDFENLGKGFWLCSFYDDQWSDSDKKFRVTVGFTSMIREDWSQYWFIRGPDGQFADVDEAKFQEVVGKDYEEGIQNQTSGILKVGFYETRDFGNEFGGFIQRQG